MDKKYRFKTQALHAGQVFDSATPSCGVQVYIGLEHVDDIIDSLNEGLAASQKHEGRI